MVIRKKRPEQDAARREPGGSSHHEKSGGEGRMVMARENSAYWNPILETLPRERLRALQVKKF